MSSFLENSNSDFSLKMGCWRENGTSSPVTRGKINGRFKEVNPFHVSFRGLE
jgi:hypothetical protein